MCTRVDALIEKIQNIHKDYVEKLQNGQVGEDGGADVLIVSQ